VIHQSGCNGVEIAFNMVNSALKTGANQKPTLPEKGVFSSSGNHKIGGRDGCHSLGSIDLDRLEPE
jgi:hypothetical protein